MLNITQYVLVRVEYRQNIFGTEQLQLQLTQTAIFEQFFEARAMDTNSSNNSSSNYCFLFELCAREAASLGVTGHAGSGDFSSRGTLFLKLFPERFFSENCANGAQDGLDMQNNLVKNDT